MDKKATHPDLYCGEVVESSLQIFVAHCWQWDKPPPFGSIVIADAGQKRVFGVVHQVATGSIDPTRTPFPYQKTREELLKEQPQIFQFLKTTFSCLVVGYLEKGIIYYLLAPEPIAIHSMVGLASREECARFFSCEQYLNLVFGASQHLFNLDELLLALLRYQTELAILSQDTFEKSMAMFSLLTGNDYRRLKMFVTRAQAFLV